MKLLDDYKKAIQNIYDYFEYEEQWHVYPIEDYRKYYWHVTETSVYMSENFIENIENLRQEYKNWYLEAFLEEIGFGYSSEICGAVSRKDDYTMILIDTHTDGNVFLAIFDNSKEIKFNATS